MKERIKEVRKFLKMTQSEFAEKLNLSGNFIFLIEKGDRQPSDRTVLDICKEFNVSEHWLRTGEGEMFAPPSRAAELSKFAAAVFKERPDSFKARLISVLANLNEDEWEVLATIAEKLAEKKD